MENDLLTIEELCNKLNLNKSWIYQRTRNGMIPCIRFGKYLRFRLDDVVEYFEKGDNNVEPNIPNHPDT
jgi:excisionase family DNA binding protein